MWRKKGELHMDISEEKREILKLFGFMLLSKFERKNFRPVLSNAQ